MATVSDSTTTVLHQVPYYSQWASPELVPAIVGGTMRAADDPRWAEYGASTPEEYEWWAVQLCGVACLRMALGAWDLDVPDPMRLAADCVEVGAYVHREDGGLDGLIYAPFAAYVRARWGLVADVRPDLPMDQITKHVAAGDLVMLSVYRTIRALDPAPPRRGGHLVLAVGADEEHVVIHDPSGLPGRSQEYARVRWSDLERFYAGRGIVLGRPRTRQS